MTTYSGLWNGVNNTPYSLQVNRSPLNRQLGRMLRKSNRSLTRLREVLDTVSAAQSINGGVAVSYPRVKAADVLGDPAAGGGLVVIESVTKVAAAQTTTASDVAKVDAITNFDTQPTYPVDLSGIGGGSKIFSAH